jgi:hypothetical protein
VDTAALTAKLERLGEVYADGLIRKERYQQQRAAILAELAELEQRATPVAPALDAVIALASNLPQVLRVATKEEARAIIAPVLSHVWVRDRGIEAITPTAAFESLLVGVWRAEVVMGCPTGFSYRIQTYPRCSRYGTSRLPTHRVNRDEARTPSPTTRRNTLSCQNM